MNELKCLKLIVDYLPEVVFLKNPDGAYLLCNSAMERLMGRPAEQLIGKTDYDFFGADLADFLRERDRAVIDAGGPVVNQEWIVFPDSEIRTLFEVTKLPIYENGLLIGLLGIARDITLELLQEREKLLRILIDHAPVSLAMLDLNMRYISTSRRWLNDYGLGDRDLTGLSHYEVFPEIPERWKTIHKRCLAGEVGSSDGDCFERADGTVQWLRWEVRPWYDKSGKVAGILILSEDITERRKTDMALRESEEQLRINATELQETNAALRVLLKQRESDKEELEERILANVRQLVFPHIVQLKKKMERREALSLVNLIESNLKEIVSSFAPALSSKLYKLTQKEILVADLVKDGRQDKEIAQILDLSMDTVKAHRRNIRRKLGIKGEKINLKTFLSQFK